MAQPIGLAPWSPSGDSAVIVDQVNEVLAEYRRYLPLTARQIFYRMVGAHHYDKTERAYKRLLDKINRGRRAGLIPFDALRDDGVSADYGPRGFDDVDDVISAIRAQGRIYRRADRLANQGALEVWVEAAGMVPQAARLTADYSAPVYSSGGFNSTTMKYDAAGRILRNYHDGRRTTILHVGDHDPSGVAIYDNLVADVTALAEDRGRFDFDRDFVTWERVAVTEAQALELDLDSAPPKSTDSRSVNWYGETYQAEALDPGTLAELITEAIERHVDRSLYDELLAEEEDERNDLIERLELAFPEED